MKLSKILMGMVSLCSIVSITFAGELTLSPASGSMGDGCKVAVDVIADTNGKTVLATDIIMLSSMDFVDFVPANAFPYFLPPVTGSNSVHIIGFVVDPSHGVSGKHVVGTAYFQKRSVSDRDGAIRLYFKKVGNTVDSNLSMGGGIDILEKVNDAYFTFDNTRECIHAAGAISGGIQSLDTTLEKISLDVSSKSPHTYIYWLSSLFLLIIVGLIYFAKTRKGKKVA